MTRASKIEMYSNDYINVFKIEVKKYLDKLLYSDEFIGLLHTIEKTNNESYDFVREEERKELSKIENKIFYDFGINTGFDIDKINNAYFLGYVKGSSIKLKEFSNIDDDKFNLLSFFTSSILNAIKDEVSKISVHIFYQKIGNNVIDEKIREIDTLFSQSKNKIFLFGIKEGADDFVKLNDGAKSLKFLEKYLITSATSL